MILITFSFSGVCIWLHSICNFINTNFFMFDWTNYWNVFLRLCNFDNGFSIMCINLSIWYLDILYITWANGFSWMMTHQTFFAGCLHSANLILTGIKIIDSNCLTIFFVLEMVNSNCRIVLLRCSTFWLYLVFLVFLCLY